MLFPTTRTHDIDDCLGAILSGRHLPYPRTVSIEPVSNLCQLKCPLCPVGRGLVHHDRKLMPLETFKAILDKIPFVRVLDLYKSGEPFLNPDLCAMIRHASDRKVKVVISSHLSFAKPDGFFDEVVKSGLQRLVVSLDGASQVAYGRYRVGGNFDLVVSNIRKVVAAREKLASRTPQIIWQFLVNRYNESDIAAARELAEELKVVLDLRPLDLDDELPDMELDQPLEERKAQWLPSDERYIADRYKGEHRFPLYPGVCTDLFTRLVINVDGSVMPCCMLWDTRNVFGNLLTQSFREVWFSRNYLDARARFVKNGFAPQQENICLRCRNYGTSPTTREKLALLLSVYRKSIGGWVKGMITAG